MGLVDICYITQRKPGPLEPVTRWIPMDTLVRDLFSQAQPHQRSFIYTRSNFITVSGPRTEPMVKYTLGDRDILVPGFGRVVDRVFTRFNKL